MVLFSTMAIHIYYIITIFILNTKIVTSSTMVQESPHNSTRISISTRLYEKLFTSKKEVVRSTIMVLVFIVVMVIGLAVE